MASETVLFDDDPTIDVVVTPTIERDYRRRNVFREMWSDHADRVVSCNGAFIHDNVRVEFARHELLADAREQWQKSDGPRGTKMSYDALVKQLNRLIGIWDRRETTPDPGFEEAAKTYWHSSPARFAVGEAAVMHVQGNEEAHGTVVEIVEPLQFRCAGDVTGPYWDAKDGRRITYQELYVVRAPGIAERWSVAPGNLRDLDGSIRHLQVVR